MTMNPNNFLIVLMEVYLIRDFIIRQKNNARSCSYMKHGIPSKTFILIWKSVLTNQAQYYR